MHDGFVDASGHQRLVTHLLMVGGLSEICLVNGFAIDTREATGVISRRATGGRLPAVAKLIGDLVEQGLHVLRRILVKIVLLIILFGLINFIISEEVIFKRI